MSASPKAASLKAAARVRCLNKREMARDLGVTVVTLDEWIAKNPDFPVQRDGGRGVGYQFDPGSVHAFVRRKGLGAVPAPKPEKAQDRVAAARADLLEQQLATRSRELVPRLEVHHALTTAYGGMGRVMHGLASQLGRRHGLSDEVIRDLRASLAEAQRAMVAEIDRSLLEPPAEGDEDV